MKILAIHADYVEYQAKKKAFKGAEEIESKDAVRVEECLVIFTAVEKSDEENKDGIIERYLSEIKKIAEQVNAVKIVLYPYAHLSSKLSNPSFGQSVMQEAQKILSSDKNFEVYRAPFGWYKSFNVSCKGHPLSELSREFGVDDSVAEGKDLTKEHKDEKFVFSKNAASEIQKVALTTGLVLAKAMSELYPESQVADVGFYHDQAFVDFSGVKLKQKNFRKISEKMKEII
ncbi:hypothetical protein CL619_03500, partial [archaeon]|nr:hypothetical protein [archaeon]